MHRINHCPVDNYLYLSNGYRYPAFEQLGPDREIPLKFPSVLLPGLRIGVFWYWELAASSSGIQKEINEMQEQSYKIK